MASFVLAILSGLLLVVFPPRRQPLFARSNALFTPPPGEEDLTDPSRLNECRARYESGVQRGEACSGARVGYGLHLGFRVR